MKIEDAVEILNSKQMKVQELAKDLGISKDLLSDILKENGYIYNNRTKLREYNGKGEPNSISLSTLINERLSSKNKSKILTNKDNNHEKVNIKSENNQKKIRQNYDDLSLTEDEIIFIKRLAKERLDWRKEYDLDYAFSKLPSRKPTKKANYEISLDTFEQFERFAKHICETKRMSRNDLVEMALRKFITDFS